MQRDVRRGEEVISEDERITGGNGTGEKKGGR
jgi:hypothetical protein